MVSDYAKEVGKRIGRARRAAGLTQAELAMALGMADRSSVANYERGGQTVSAEQLMKIAAAIGCDPRWLLTGWESAEPVMTAWAARSAVSHAAQQIRAVLDELEGEAPMVARPGSGSGHCEICNEPIVPGDLNSIIDHIRVMHPDEFSEPARWPDGGLVTEEDPDPAEFAGADPESGASID